jgi:hypothetical protein
MGAGALVWEGARPLRAGVASVEADDAYVFLGTTGADAITGTAQQPVGSHRQAMAGSQTRTLLRRRRRHV